MATVKELTTGGYQVTVSGTEFSLLRSALDEAERVSRFGIEVLDEADRSQGRRALGEQPAAPGDRRSGDARSVAQVTAEDHGRS